MITARSGCIVGAKSRCRVRQNGGQAASLTPLERILVRVRTLQVAQRIMAAIMIVILVSVTLIIVRMVGFDVPLLNQLIPQGLVGAAFGKQVALISGHAGNDSGAVCTDDVGATLLTEAAVNADVTQQVAQRLRRAGADVLVLDEFDSRLATLRADLLLSLHADSCVEASGYKAATSPTSAVRERDQQLIECIDQIYPAVTGLAHHPNTITHDMTNYHAFRIIDRRTPAAIIEMGFLGGDQALLVEHPERVAQAITESILCFLAARD
jgi:N-acetylmuramoyl-L-alanine amidase